MSEILLNRYYQIDQPEFNLHIAQFYSRERQWQFILGIGKAKHEERLEKEKKENQDE